MAGGQSGKVIVPGHARDSILYQRVAGLSDQARMPMGGKLSADQIEKIRIWIDQGADWPATSSRPSLVEPTKKPCAFRPPLPPPTPHTTQPNRATHPPALSLNYPPQ